MPKIEREDEKMYILTDGKNYVMENPMKLGSYISTTSPIQAKKFTWKQVKTLVHNNKKSMSWIKSYNVVCQDTGETCEELKYYKGNGGAYIGKNDVKFDDGILSKIYQEAASIIGLAGWSMTQLKTYEEELTIGLLAFQGKNKLLHNGVKKLVLTEKLYIIG